MKELTLADGSTWPDPSEYEGSIHPGAEAYKDLIMGGLSLQ